MTDPFKNPKELSRRAFLRHAAAVTVGASTVWLFSKLESAKAMQYDMTSPIIPAPSDSAEWANWRASLVAWRGKSQQELHYDGSLYDQPEFAWSSRCFSCGFVMMCDETFYDYQEGRYTLTS